VAPGPPPRPRHLAPAALTATADPASATLRPHWTLSLALLLDTGTAARVLADPGWPALVAAVNHAQRHGWQPADALRAAHDLLLGGRTPGAPLRPDELATALAWHVELLTETTPTATRHLPRADSPHPNADADMADRGAITTPGKAGAQGGDTASGMADDGARDRDCLAGRTPPEDPYAASAPSDADTDAARKQPGDGRLDPGPGGPRDPGGADTGREPPAGSGDLHDTGDADNGPGRDLLEGLEFVLTHRWRPTGAAAPAPTSPPPTPPPPGMLYPTAGETAAAAVTRSRVLRLNSLAGEFFADRYPRSWAAGYLAGRLGTDLTGDHRFSVGYAPDGWTTLTEHLRAHGALDTDILAAGLGTPSGAGRIIDRFRDRLMFPIRDGGEIHGWVGRRHPDHADHADHAANTGTDQRAGSGRGGPKYLNTATNPVFSEGRELFGLTENAAALAAGATPALVEGPIDAIAVTLAGDRAGLGPDDQTYVGMAPLGTALTPAQADRLAASLGDPRAGSTRPNVIVATDNDRAGQQAAHRAYWQLTARGHTPGQLLLPAGTDPAELLQTHGPQALAEALHTAPGLAHAVIAARIPLTHRLHTACTPPAHRLHTACTPPKDQCSPPAPTMHQVFEDTIALARRAEELDFARYWMAEHHGVPGVASSAPVITVGALAAATSRIHVGTGGVMLPNHVPLVVAEQFGTLASLYPGRIDLGVGRGAPDPQTAQVLARSLANYGRDDFEESVAELSAYLTGESPDGRPYRGPYVAPRPTSPRRYGCSVPALTGRPTWRRSSVCRSLSRTTSAAATLPQSQSQSQSLPSIRRLARH